MQLDLNEKQYKQLVELIFLGEWMLNSFREKIMREHDETARHIYGQADKFAQMDLMEQNQFKEFSPKDDLADRLFKLVDEYDDFTFRNMLIGKLAERDFKGKYTQTEIAKMNEEEEEIKLQPYINKYVLEIRKNGIKNLTIKA